VLAIAAHELRAPATAMGGYAQLILRKIRRSDSMDRASIEATLDLINHHARRMDRLVARLLDAARIDANTLCVVRRETDLQGLVFNVVNLWCATAPERHVVVDAPIALCAEVDALRIEEVLSNLVDNALKFSPSETSVEVRLRLRGDNTAVLSVRDHGVGVPVDRRDCIFDRFVQAHRERRSTGLGLGLYLSRHIVQQHGGRLTAEYPADGGARFVVELPVLRAEAATPPAHPQFAAA
jgi:signal transduction histidine kinase